MKTKIDQPSNCPSPHPNETEPGRIPAVDPPERPFGYLSSYDAEWAAFVKEQSRHRTRSGLTHSDLDDRPRVWNCPLG